MRQITTRATVPISENPHHFPQVWLLILSLIAFGFYVAWDRNLLTLVFTLDRSYMAMMIAALIVLATGHAAWHILHYSRLLESARTLLEDPTQHDATLLAGFLDDLDLVPSRSGRHDGRTEPVDTSDSLIEIYAERLRAPVDLGWFLVDLAIRLGLLGTIIGFILIFSSLSGVSLDAADGLKDLLVAMSGGMGTALLTTLSGLVAATVISVQYLVLSRASDQLIGQLVRLRLRRAALADDTGR